MHQKVICKCSPDHPTPEFIFAWVTVTVKSQTNKGVEKGKENEKKERGGIIWNQEAIRHTLFVVHIKF